MSTILKWQTTLNNAVSLSTSLAFVVLEIKNTAMLIAKHSVRHPHSRGFYRLNALKSTTSSGQLNRDFQNVFISLTKRMLNIVWVERIIARMTTIHNSQPYCKPASYTMSSRYHNHHPFYIGDRHANRGRDKRSLSVVNLLSRWLLQDKLVGTARSLELLGFQPALQNDEGSLNKIFLFLSFFLFGVHSCSCGFLSLWPESLSNK